MTKKPRDRQQRAMFANMLNRPRHGKKGKGAKLSTTKLHRLQAQRPALSRSRDEAQTAEDVIQPGSPELTRWLEEPNRVDVAGIDTKEAKPKRGLFGKKSKPSP